MSVVLYCDVHVRRAVTEGLRLREIDVLTAQEDGAATMDNPVLLECAMALGRVVFTQDEDFLREAHRRQETGEAFAGVIYAQQLNITIGQCVSDLELITKEYTQPMDSLIPSTMKIDKTALSLAPCFDISDEKDYWLSRTPIGAFAAH